MANNILLSIIIPIYNVEQYIKECLDSVTNCSSNEYEIIVVNDGTPDGSMETVYRYQQLHQDKIKIIEQENKGLSIARNNGIKKAVGKYIWCVDSDDYLTNDAIISVLTLIKKNNLEILAMPLNWCYENGKSEIDFNSYINGVISGTDYLENKFPLGASQRYIIKKEFIKKYNLNFVSGKLHEDGDFGLRLLYYAQNILILNKSFYNYRIRNNGSIMSSWKVKNSLDLFSIYDDLLDLILSNPLKKNTKPYFDALFQILIATITFAKSKWNTSEFKNFYSGNKRSIIQRSKIIRPYIAHSIKRKIKVGLFILSPLLLCKLLLYKKK